eukprot:733835-Hanusia_phi.AAC.2
MGGYTAEGWGTLPSFPEQFYLEGSSSDQQSLFESITTHPLDPFLAPFLPLPFPAMPGYLARPDPNLLSATCLPASPTPMHPSHE